MKYKNVCSGVFLNRPNRFIAEVDINGSPEICHVKNTGRCAELLVPGAEVFLQRAEQGKRKTAYDLIAVWKGSRLINMDSQAPNRAVHEWLASGSFMKHVSMIKPEAFFQRARLDFYIEVFGRNGGRSKIFLEVKGVTLEENGAAFFPDAPTERGIRHIEHLCAALRQGYEAWLFFVVQMEGVKYFAPNMKTHPAFGEALIAGKEAGIKLFAWDCLITPDSIDINRSVPVRL